jgi:phenylpropionate dioxygenase-like ring-hydroxylating dioxygenase large terminal subunit
VRNQTTDAKEVDLTVAEEAENGWGEEFNWKKAWYPMAVIQDMDEGRPNKLQLLGEKLVAWKDGEGEWRVFEDRCPHRNVPLSEGRIEKDGNLMCSYHGWRFNGEGKLVELPQATEEQLPRLQANPRSCAPSRPTQVRNEVLWVWGECGPDAALEAALVEPNNVKEMEDPELKGRASMGCWSHRDVPYGWDVAFENVTDPAHVTVAHHNIVSNRYTSPGPITIDFTRKPTNKDGFKFKITNLDPKKKDPNVVSTMDFRPPCQMHIKTHYLDTDASLTLIINFVPTKPGWSRLVGSTLLINGKNGEKPPGFAIYSAPLPRWMVHLLAPAFLHQDQVFLHHQQAILERQKKKEGVDWDKSYWIPTQADKGTVTLRRWLDKNGGMPAWVASVSPEDVEKTMTDGVLFDTYKTHTEQCVVCQAALKRTKLLRRGLEYGAVVAGAAGVASTSVPMLAGGLALGLGATACSKLQKMFYEVPFNHQDNN